MIVGHLPTSNFYKNQINNDICFDEDKKIISIDGGTGVKFISQLNALIIEKDEQGLHFNNMKFNLYLFIKSRKIILLKRKKFIR